jgi:anthrone oxygenase-like protein
VTAWLPWLATMATGLFAGAALYVTLVEHPARVGCGPLLAVAEFRRSYPRGAALQAPLALAGGLAGVGAWLAGAAAGWLGAGALLGAVVPYTLAVVAPTNRRLLDRALPPDTPEATRLLRRWGWLHLVRTVASLLAFGWMLRLLLPG